MKKLLNIFLLGSILVLSPFSASFAACGLGNEIWGENGGFGKKAMASTTNVWTMKGISTTFEIFGCGPEDNWFKTVSNEKVRYYASQNLDHLAAQCARGQGEHLDAIAYLIQIREEDLERFHTLAQANFESLFSHDKITADEMLDNLKQLMIKDKIFSSYVEV